MKNGADPNIRNKSNQTPSHWAAKSVKNEMIIRYLGEGGANFNEPDSTDMTLLDYALEHGSLQIVKTFLEFGCDLKLKKNTGVTAVHLAAQNTREGVLGFVLEQIILSVNDRTVDGPTSLHFVISGNFNNFKLLLDFGAEVDAKNSSGETPIFKAIHFRMKEKTELLLAHGAVMTEEIFNQMNTWEDYQKASR